MGPSQAHKRENQALASSELPGVGLGSTWAVCHCLHVCSLGQWTQMTLSCQLPGVYLLFLCNHCSVDTVNQLLP